MGVLVNMSGLESKMGLAFHAFYWFVRVDPVEMCC